MEENFFARDNFSVDVAVNFQAAALDVGFDFGGFANVNQTVGEKIAEVFSDAADASVNDDGAIGFNNTFNFCSCRNENLIFDVSLCGQQASFVRRK